MRKIIDIFDVFEVKNRGIVIAGVNQALDPLTRDQIRDFVGTEVEVVNRDGAKRKYRVFGVQVTSSIIDKKNIFILLPPDVRREDIEMRAVVYSSGSDPI